MNCLKNTLQAYSEGDLIKGYGANVDNKMEYLKMFIPELMLLSIKVSIIRS